MKKIAYIELDTHAEIAGVFMELIQDSDQFLVDFYFSPKICKQVETASEKIFEVQAHSLLAELTKEKYSLVIIGTVHRYFDVFLNVAQNFNTAVIVHNVNFTKRSRFQLFKNIFKHDFKYRLKLLLKEDLLSAPKVFQKAKKLLVLDEDLMKANSDLSLKFLPVFYLSEYEKQQNSTIIIVIPGAVSQQRRDYRHVLKCLKRFKRNTHYQIVFLGKAAGEELRWIEEFEKQNLQNISVKYYTEKVPQQLFNEWMEKAGILWCPLQHETEFFSQKEFYGITKMSGNVGDAIKYGKTGIFPADYPNSNPFIIAENENVEEQISTLTQFGAYDFQEKYAKEKVLKTLEQTLLNLL